MKPFIKEIESVEITMLQDNYIDVLAMDSNGVVQRPLLVKEIPGKGMELSLSPVAEHGFSAFITIKTEGIKQSMVYDFGCSSHGAAFNADLLSVDLTKVQVVCLSHGHLDHVGGMKEIVSRVKKNNLELVVHPVAFREKRYVKTPAGENFFFPTLTRDYVREANLSIKETTAPLAVLEGNVLFLGEIPRDTDFEEGMKNAFYEQDGIEKPDAIEDDSALVFNVKKKGLVILTGCAHSGIINTVNYAKELTGVENIFAVVGGLHLTGLHFQQKSLRQ